MTTETEQEKDHQQYLTAREAAAIARVNPQTMLRYARTKAIPSIRVGNRTLIARADLDTFMRNGAQ